MSRPVFYQGGGYWVTDRLLTTPRKAYALAKVEYVSVTRPLLWFAAGPAIGLSGVGFVFRRYLYSGEIAVLAAISTVAIVLALRVGALRVHSLALRDNDVSISFGPIGRLRQVRAAVERAMAQRSDGRDGE